MKNSIENLRGSVYVLLCMCSGGKAYCRMGYIFVCRPCQPYLVNYRTGQHGIMCTIMYKPL